MNVTVQCTSYHPERSLRCSLSLGHDGICRNQTAGVTWAAGTSGEQSTKLCGAQSPHRTEDTCCCRAGHTGDHRAMNRTAGWPRSSSCSLTLGDLRCRYGAGHAGEHESLSRETTWISGDTPALNDALHLLGSAEIKPRFDLLPFDALEEVARVLAFGSQKHSPEAWRHDPDAVERYFNSALAHIAAWKQGEHRDADSKLPHLAHAATKLLFLVALTAEEKGPADGI